MERSKDWNELKESFKVKFKHMEEKIHFIDPLLEKVEEYGKTSYELFKLKALDKTVGITSTFISDGIVGFFLFMLLIITTIGVALMLGDWLGKAYYGFFCVAGFYGIMAGIVHFYKSWVKKCVSDSIVSHILN